MSVHSFFIIQGGETSAGNRALMWETGSNIWWRSFFFSPSPFECHTRMTHGFAPWQFDYFLLYLPRRQINREIKDDAVNFLFAFVSLCLSDGSVAGVCVGGVRKAGELPGGDKNPAGDAFCILIRLQSEAGGGWVGGGNTGGDFQRGFSGNLKISPKVLDFLQSCAPHCSHAVRRNLDSNVLPPCWLRLNHYSPSFGFSIKEISDDCSLLALSLLVDAKPICGQSKSWWSPSQTARTFLNSSNTFR